MSRVATGMREKLLDAACELIVQVGYKGIKLQEVCKKANANIASVNYYFGSKKGLYRAVLDYAHEKIASRFNEEAMRGLSVTEKVRQLAYMRMLAVLDDGPGGWFPKIIHREAMDPSELHDEVFEQILKPKRECMRNLIIEFLGEGATKLQVQTAMYSFQSQCIHLLALKSRKKVFFAKPEGMSCEEQVELATELTDALMCGLISYKESIQRRNNEK